MLTYLVVGCALTPARRNKVQQQHPLRSNKELFVAVTVSGKQ